MTQEISGPEIDLRFTSHSPTGNQPQRYQEIRSYGHGMAACIVNLTPASREQSLALTKLEEAVFWANAAIARRDGKVEGADSAPPC